MELSCPWNWREREGGREVYRTRETGKTWCVLQCVADVVTVGGGSKESKHSHVRSCTCIHRAYGLVHKHSIYTHRLWTTCLIPNMEKWVCRIRRAEAQTLKESEEQDGEVKPGVSLHAHTGSSYISSPENIIGTPISWKVLLQSSWKSMLQGRDEKRIEVSIM